MSKNMSKKHVLIFVVTAGKTICGYSTTTVKLGSPVSLVPALANIKVRGAGLALAVPDCRMKASLQKGPT
jgi:hypothetical protein